MSGYNFKKYKKIFIGLSIALGVIIFLFLFFGLAFNTRKELMGIEAQGIELYEQGEYLEAIETFQKIPNYKGYHNVKYYYDMCMENLKAENLKNEKVIICPHCGELILEGST